MHPYGAAFSSSCRNRGGGIELQDVWRGEGDSRCVSGAFEITSTKNNVSKSDEEHRMGMFRKWEIKRRET